MATADLAKRKCQSCEGKVSPLKADEIDKLLKQLDGWALQGDTIAKTYAFKNYYQTLAFVNAAAWVSHREDHHPDIVVGYNQCLVTYVTHAINGLSENDFICAAKLDALFDL
jgi:4a-hydroxytetrahydrobiopterin dehydratase